MSRDQNAGRSHNINTDNNSFERVDSSTFKNQNSIQEEITSRMNSENACYNSMQNLLFFNLLSKIIKIQVYRTIILPVVLYGCET